MRYKLFNKFRVVNAPLLKEDIKRAARREKGEALNGGDKKRKRGKEAAPPVVVSASRPGRLRGGLGSGQKR